MNLRVLLATGAILLAVWLIVRFIRTVSYPLREKVVLITGGSRGLGLVLARHICARGGNVALIARDAEELARAKIELDAGINTVMIIQVDLRDIFFSSRRRHTRSDRDWSSDVCSSDLFCLRSEEHTSELQSRSDLVCRLLLEKRTAHV